jgi:glycosyltransferase involved in cell wall biosynthesis
MAIAIAQIVCKGHISTIAAVKVLLVSFYWPPAGGGGVQRPLKLAQYLPALGIETHVLAPDDPRWLHRDDGLRAPTDAWVHRARYLGPSGGKPAELVRSKDGIDRVLLQARLQARRLIVPDENALWTLSAIPAATRLVREHAIDAILTTSPPGSTHLVGAAVKRATGAAWLADLRDSLVAHAHRRADTAGTKTKAAIQRQVARLVARQADAISCVSEAIAEEVRALEPRGRVVAIANGCDFDDFAGLEYEPATRFRITHAGSFFGRRDPRPFLQAVHDTGLDVVARFVGDFRSSDREWADRLGLGDRLELIPYAPRATALELQRDSEALLLLIPEAGGRGRGVLSGKVFEYLAAQRPILAAVPPDGAAAELIEKTGAGVVAAPDDADALAEALTGLVTRFRNGGLPDVELADGWRDRLSRRARVEETADLLRSIA